jgi:NTE family protein
MENNLNLENIENLVISGGSIKGFCFIGAIKYLEELNIIKQINTFTGTSVGGCLALLLNIGYTSKELTELFTNINIDYYKDINLDKIINFFETYAIDDGNKILNILKIVVLNKLNININNKYDENITFKQLYEFTNKKITIVGCCLTDMDTIYYNYEETPDVKLFDALRITFSIPFIFTPIKLDDKIYVDGGLLNNYPIELYDKKTTIGLISTNINIYNRNINSIESYISSIIFITYYNNIQKKLNDYKHNTINLEHNIDVLDFSIDKNKKHDLINYGYNKTKELIDTYNFFEKSSKKSLID